MKYRPPIISCVSFVNSITILELNLVSFSLFPTLMDLTLEYPLLLTYCSHILPLTSAVDLHHLDKPAKS